MLILASASQSRKRLLVNSDIKFQQVSSDFDESTIKNEKITDLAINLSFSKAVNVFNKISGSPSSELLNNISLEILGCDSIFEFNQESFGKPANKEEAYDRWLKMSSGMGYLHTGHTLLFCKISDDKKNIIINKEIKEVISSKIFFEELLEKEIIQYVETLEPLNCAGGFALEGRGG